MKPEMTPWVLASLLLGALALPSSPSSSINEQRSENYKSTGNPNPISSSSSDSNVHSRRVFSAYERTHSTNENNNSSINNIITEKSAYSNRYKTNSRSNDSYDMFLASSDTNSQDTSKPPKIGEIGFTAATPQAKQIKYQPYHRYPVHYIQKKIHQIASSLNTNSKENTRNEVLPRAESGKLQDSYLQDLPLSMVYSGHSNSLNDLQDSYLQGSSTTMVHTAHTNSLDDLQDSYLQGSSATIVHTVQPNSLDDLQDSYLQGSSTDMENSVQSNSSDDLQDSYLQGSSTDMENSAQSNSLDYLQGNYLSPQSNSFDGLQNSNLLGSSTGMQHSALPSTIGNLQDSHLQGSADASSLYDVKDNYFKGNSVAKTPWVNSNSFDSLQDSYLQGSNTLDVPLVYSNSYDDLENNYLKDINAVDVPLTQSNGFGNVHQQDAYFQGDSAADTFVPGGLGLESEAQGIVSGALQMDQQPNYTALALPSENQSFSLPPMPPVPIYYQTPPPLQMLSSTYNYTLPSSPAVTSAPYYYLIPPPTSNSQPSMSSEPYINTATLPQPTLETSVAYEYHPPPPIPTTVTSVPYDYQPPLEAPVAYDYPVPSPPTLTSAPYYYNPPPVPPSLHYLPAPTPPPATPPPATPIATVEFVPYNIGAKIWFIPLIFSAYFAVYITALILKSIIRHKFFFPTNLLYAATDTERDYSTNLDHLSKLVTRAIATAVIKYVRGKT